MRDTQCIGTVAEDVRYLRDKWDGGIDDTSLRVISPLLRRLLVFGDLGKAWRAADFKGEPSIRAVSLRPLVESAERQAIAFASAGGATCGGVTVQGVLIQRGRSLAPNTKKHRVTGPAKETTGLWRFVEAPCLFYKGRAISRRHVITFVCDKLGGAHLDYSPKKSGEAEPFALLVEMLATTQKDCIYFELLAAGQAIAQADDVTTFLKRAHRLEAIVRGRR